MLARPIGLISAALLLSAGLGTIAAGCGGATIESACASYVDVACNKYFECIPYLGEALFGDIDTCKKMDPIRCVALLELEDAATPDQLAACSSAYNAVSCKDLFEGNIPDACLIKGTRADGDACSSSVQCESGSCASSSDDMCGVCAKTVEAGGSCGTNDACAPGLYCTGDGVCAKFGGEGDSCGLGLSCGFSLSCVQGKCTANAKEGVACDITGTGAQCSIYDGLVCSPTSNSCEKIKLVGAGEDCGLVGGDLVGCKRGSCNEQTQKCEALLAEGVSCSGGDCDVGLACVDGKCTTGFKECN